MILNLFSRDKTKKKYIQNQDGQNKKGMRKDKEDKLMKDGKNKDLFKKWQKKNQMQYQKVGEMENQDMTSKARQMFMYRKKRHGGEEANDYAESNYKQGGRKNLSKGGKGGHGKGKGGSMKGRGNDVRKPEQIMKMKKKNLKNKLLNMQKDKRKQVLGGKKGKKKSR